MLSWSTKYTLDILEEICDVCEVYESNLSDYREVVKVLIDRVTAYIDQL